MLILKVAFFLTCISYQKMVEAEPIRGGTEVTNPTLYPFMASLRYQIDDHPHKHYCGGSIIDKRHVLTAGHCLKDLDYDKVVVAVGTLRINEISAHNTYGVDNWFSLKSFSADHPVTAVKDLGLIRLKYEIQTSANVQPIPLDTTNSVKEDDELVIMGFGQAGPDCTERVDTLHELKTSIVSADFYAESNPSYNAEDDLVICTFCYKKVDFENDESKFFTSCKGDSGGPVVSFKSGKAVLVGVMSTSTPLFVNAVKVFRHLGDIAAMKSALDPYSK